MTLPRLWAFLAIALPVLASLIGNLSSVDLAYHLRAGQMTLDTGHIPTADTFTFTAAGTAWLNQQWGAQVVLEAIYRVAGWTGLVVLRAGVVGMTFGLLFEICRRRGVDLRRAAWLTLAAFFISAVALSLRPQLFGMALFALTLLLVADRRAHPARLWAVPFIVCVWANVHGSFVLGPLVLGLAWLEDVHGRFANPHRLLLIAALAAAAALINPFGIGVWGYAAGLSANSFVTSQISEWQPTTLRTIPGVLFFGSVGAVVALLVRRARIVAWPTLLWLAVFALIGAYAIRGVAWWPIAAVAVVADLVSLPDGAVASRPERTRRLNLIVAGVIVAACAVLVPVWRPVDPGLRAPAGVVGDAPSGITAALRDIVRPGDRILNPQAWGSWFEFALPEATIAIDSRIEVYPAAVWSDYTAVRHGTSGWQAILAQWAPTVVVTERDEGDLVDRLRAEGWKVLFQDQDGSIVSRAP